MSASQDSVRAAFAEIAKRHPRIDVLINNAAVYEPFFVKDATDDQILGPLLTNLAGPIFTCRAAIPMMDRGAAIINVSSESVGLEFPMLSLYQSTKAGMERFSQSLSRELEARGYPRHGCPRRADVRGRQGPGAMEPGSGHAIHDSVQGSRHRHDEAADLECCLGYRRLPRTDRHARRCPAYHMFPSKDAIHDHSSRSKLYIDGKLCGAANGATFDVIDPWTGEVAGKAADGGEAEVNVAIAAARKAFDTTDWSTNHEKRLSLVKKLRELFEANRDRLVRTRRP